MRAEVGRGLHEHGVNLPRSSGLCVTGTEGVEFGPSWKPILRPPQKLSRVPKERLLIQQMHGAPTSSTSMVHLPSHPHQPLMTNPGKYTLMQFYR